ncbi:hypothetical protein ACFUCQ_20630 [Streptomyces sp. NPDC057197]|uniref:hypothetical protein n=1 Tax=unclassified Streptomyces TaxID=2593676 RepID=UPI0007DDE00E|nr:hypothetical protein [Streptomyces sp. SAT1]ANH92522.1 hypothetical protein A8713_16265 [Streptomyces sp. SAT1]
MDEISAVRKLRADVPVPDPARLASARRRLMDEVSAAPGRPPAWRLKVVTACVAVVATALVSTLLLRPERTAPADAAPRADRWVYQKVRWDTRWCGTGTLAHGYSEVGSFSLGSSARPCRGKSAEPAYQERWIRYDGGALATPDDSTDDPDDVDVWKGSFQDGWEMLAPGETDALIAALPADPQGALRLIRARSVPTHQAYTLRLSRAERDLVDVAELLSGASEVPPDKARTIHGVITALDDAKAPVRTTDGLGRRVLAFGLGGAAHDDPGARSRMQVLLDPDTFAYRGIRYVAGLDRAAGDDGSTGPSVPEGTVLAVASRVTTGLVDRAGRRA